MNHVSTEITTLLLYMLAAAAAGLAMIGTGAGAIGVRTPMAGEPGKR